MRNIVTSLLRKLALTIALITAFVPSLRAAGGYADAVMADGPIAYYRFNDSPPTAVNSGSAGAAANGTYNGGATSGAQAPAPPAFVGFEPSNTALQCNGTDAFMGTAVGLFNPTYIPGGVFTISGWLRRNGDQANRTGLWGQNDIMEIGYINNNTLEVWTDNGLDIAPNPFPNGEWAHLAVVSTGSPGTIFMYTNGVLAGSRSHSLPNVLTFNFNVGGGGVFDGTGNFFNGQIDEVAVFSTALSAAQISAQYNAAFTPITPFPKFVNVGGNAIGSTTFDQPTGTLTVVGGGNDIWATHDEFAYAYDTRAGDFDVRVRVESLTPTARWSKAGIMVRETLAEDSRMVFLRVTPPDVATSNGGNGANDIKLAYRTGAPNVAGESGGEHEDPTAQNPPPYPNAWLRLTRSGSVFAAHISADGSTWTTITSQDTAAGDWLAGGGAFKDDVTVGLAVSRHSGGPSATAVFRDVAFTDPATFAMSYASSRGNPNAILVSFTQAPDAATLVPASFDVLGLTINSVTPGPFTHSYWLNVDPSTPLVEGTTYSVTAFSVTADGGVTGPVPDTDTFVHAEGFENVGVHVGHNEEGGGVGGLRNRTSFARGLFSPTEGQRAFESNGFFEDPLPDNGQNETFTTKIFGLLNVTTAGDYRFACSSDDFGELFLSTDDNPANKRLIAREPVWNGSRQYAVADRRSAQPDLPQNGALCNQTPAITLAAGQYYLEYLFAEGGGGNNGSVAWLPAGGTFANGQTPITAAEMAPSRYQNGPERGVLFRNLGAVSITRQPASQTVIGGSAVTFSAGVDGTPAYRYQWRKNGQPIAGANGPTYSIAAAVLSDEGSYSLSVANEFSSASSASATLTVNIPTPPVLVSAAPDETFVRVFVSFDKRLQPSSAQNAANYSLSGGATVSSATLNPAGTGVVLATSPLAEGTTYTLTVSNVREITGNNALSPNPSTASFQTLVFSPGFAQANYYFNNSLGIDALIANPPIPSFVCYSNLWEIDDSGNSRENYGGRLAGYFVPETTGDYVFYIATDDPGRLFLSTDANPANKVLIAIEPVWSGSRTYVGEAGGGGRAGVTTYGGPQANISAPIALVAGQRYYMESWFTEGGGGDNMAVAVQGPGQAAPVNGDAPVGGARIGTYASPAGASAAITQNPADQTRAENTFVTFTAAGTAASTGCGAATSYQWFRNGAPVIGANSPSYTLGPLTPADNGARFKLRVATLGAFADSTEATLTVVAPQPLRVARAEGVCNLTQVRVVFDQFVDATTGGDEFNYAVAGFGVADATVNPDNLSVTLTLDGAQTPGQTYCVTVSGVTSASGLAVDPNPTTVCFPSCVISCGFGLQELYGAVGTGLAPISGVNLTDLEADARYPNRPDRTRYVGQLSANNGDEFDNYGTRIVGWILPPVSGDYVFYLAADDGGDFWLSTDNSPANLVKVATEPVWAARRNYIGEADGGGRAGVVDHGGPQANITANIPLVAGQMYYFQARMKEGGGGDNLDVAWQIPGGPAPVDGGAPISGAFLASLANPAGASVTITQQPADACVEEGNIATFTVGINATTASGPAASAFYQWYRMTPGGSWLPIGGAVNATYAPTVSIADNGNKYRVAIYVPGATATSAEVTLTTYHVNTAPKFTGGADQTANCGASATVAGWATGIQPHSITRTPTTLASSFASGAGITLAGVASVADGALKLTGLTGSQYGAGSASFPLRNFESLNVAWKSLVGGSGDGADGYSLNIGDDLPADPGYGGEDGIGNNLRLTVDTFDNGGGEDGIGIVWRGNTVAFQQIPKNDPGTGVYIRKNTFVDASASVDAAGLATFTYDGQTISGALPGYTGVSATRVLFWARTGGAFDNHWIDDVAFTGFPYDASSVENGQAVAFQVTGNDNPGLFASGPSISANGTLSYTLAACAQGSANVTVVLKDDAGTATCAGPRGSDTSASYTFKISVTPDTAPPSITCPANIVADGSGANCTAAVTYTAAASDNCCVASVVCVPASGSSFAVGTTPVTCTATDGAGNTARCTFTVTVRECCQPPVAVIHSEQLIDLSPEFDHPVLISCNWWNACLVADGWTSSTTPPGGDLAYLWFLEGEVTPIGAGPVITNCLEVGTHTLVLTVTDPACGKSATASQTIEVVTAPLAIDLLIEQINESHKHGVVLSRKIKRELTETLRVALNHAGRERLRETQKALDAFEKKVRAQVAKTEPEAAAAWIRWSQAVSEGMEKCIKPPRKSKDHDDRK